MTTQEGAPTQCSSESPNIKQKKSKQGPHSPTQTDTGPSSTRRTRSTLTERYLAPFEGLSVWTRDWSFPDKMGVTKTNLKPFSQVFGETDSIHEAIMVRNKTSIPNKTGFVHSVTFWKDLFLEGFDKRKTFHISAEVRKAAKQLAIRLALTSPTIFGDEMWIEGVHLQGRNDTAAWAAAQQILGTWRWRPNEIQNDSEKPPSNVAKETNENSTDGATNENDTQVTPNRDMTSKDDLHSSKNDQRGKTKNSVNFNEQSIDPKFRNRLFIQKMSVVAKTKNNPLTKDYDRKQKIFIKWKSPKLTKSSFEEMESEIASYFLSLYKHLHKLDEKIIIIPWNEYSEYLPMDINTQIPDRAIMERYVDRIFLRIGAAVWCRLQIAFDVEEHMITGDDWYQGNGMYLTKEPVQEKNLSGIGWLLGSHKNTNTKDLREILNDILPKANQIDLRFHAIKIRAGERILSTNAVKAVHIYAGSSSARATLKILKNIYRKDNKDGYPLGSVMRVVTNTADARTPVSPRMRTNTEILKNKQTVFQNSIMTLPNHYIQSLDLFLPSAGVSLRQAIMGIKTSSKQSQSLFISADSDSWGRTIFSFHKKNETEAINIVPVLPIYLAHHYGARSWSWFNQEAKDDLSDYYYDEKSGEIRCNEDKYIQEIVDENRWEDNEFGKKISNIQFDFSLAKWVVDVDNMATGNQYGDNGTVKTGMQSTDDTDPSTMTDQSPGGISTLTGESDRAKLLNILKHKSDSDIADFLLLISPKDTESNLEDRNNGPSQE